MPSAAAAPMFFCLSWFVLTFIYISMYTSTVNVRSIKNNPSLIADYSQKYINTLAYLLPLMFSNFICSIFANYAVIVDKAKRNIESLMATPVSIKQIWMGKSLAVTLPSIGIGIGMSIIAYLVLDIGFVMPKTGSFISTQHRPNSLRGDYHPGAAICHCGHRDLHSTDHHQSPNRKFCVFRGFHYFAHRRRGPAGAENYSTNYLAMIYLGLILICAGNCLSSFLLTDQGKGAAVQQGVRLEANLPTD